MFLPTVSKLTDGQVRDGALRAAEEGTHQGWPDEEDAEVSKGRVQ